MSDELVTAMRRYGAALAPSQDAASPQQALFGTVVSLSGSTAKVSVKGATLDMPVTTSCAGAKKGDRCIVQMVGPHAVVTGVIAR